jgi:polar amino acid transport system permease protein
LPEIGIRLGVVLSAVLTLVANEGAYLAVIVAASMATLPRGQLDAAKMLGLSRARAVRYVELPQAARSLVPILGNQYNAMMKTTSLLSIIAFSELLEFTQTEVNLTYQPVEAFAVAAIYYLAMTTLWSGIQLVLEKRLEIPVGPRTSLARRLVLPAGS